MTRTKIQDEREVCRWFEEGRTYAWMVEEYERRYDLQVGASMFGNFRRRRGIARRIARDDDLIPWLVKREHRWAYPVQMLRALARQREGRPLRDVEARKLTSWLDTRRRERTVVDYAPDSEEGFRYVPRLPSDEDVIRRPDRKTTARRASD